MKASLQQKLIDLTEQHQTLEQQLSDPKIVSDQERFKKFSKEYAKLSPIVKTFKQYQATEEAEQNAHTLLEDADAEIKALAEEELTVAQEQKEKLEQELKVLLLPQDPNDDKDVFLEIRAGTGGNEAAIFAGDLFRMYSRYAELKHWAVEIVNASLGEQGGYKEIIARISGQGVYSRLKFESGAHRVQRVPATESQGRIHTSACTVAVMPEVDEIGEIEINPSDLRIDTFRASGAGGQHVNRTDSAIRITHMPTGLVVECQDERSQHKNRARAMSVLKAKLLAAERSKQEAEQAATRRSLVGTGDRSERIRTYNFPQGRLTDHRINLTLYKLLEIMEGHLDQVIDPLIQEHQADLLQAQIE